MARSKTRMVDIFSDAARARELHVVEEIVIPARAEQRMMLPKKILNSATGKFIKKEMFPKGDAWVHQSMALNAYCRGDDVAVTTPTASGKSLVFQAAGSYCVEQDPSARVIGLYPLKALAADQIPGWRSHLAGIGLDPDQVVEVTGNVEWSQRAKLLSQARVAIMTPDVLHSWAMSNLNDPAVRSFIANIRLIAIDEAHVLESVFGSNVSFLLRRLETAKLLLGAKMGKSSPLQYIATSATIAEPGRHLRDLTGRDFTIITDLDDGSPQYGRRVIHLAPKTAAPLDLVDIQKELLERSDNGSFISFVDSRAGTERLALASGSGVLAYRSGYKPSERRRLEANLKAGRTRGVMSTSALEAGVNMSAFQVGFNLGVPDSRRSLHQRIGRVGRASVGVFAVIAAKDEFQKFGEKFSDFVCGDIEECSLYLNNRFLQWGHAKCLAKELQAIGLRGRPALPSNISWPDGFKEIFSKVTSGAPAPTVFERVDRLSGDRPHLGLPLRDMVEKSYQIGISSQEPLGTLSHRNALFEAYPGAVYLHMGKAYEVTRWGTGEKGKPSIRVIPTSTRRSTRPIMNTYANLDLETGIVDGNFRAGPGGFMAECRLRVTEKVEGLIKDDARIMYSELSQRDPSKSSKSRSFETTGIVLCLGESFGNAKGVRDDVGRALLAKLRRAKAIVSGDVDFTTSNVTLECDGVMVRADNAIVLYDTTYGSLRFTEPLFEHFDEYVGDLLRGGQMTDTGYGILPRKVLEGLTSWAAGLSSASVDVAREVLLETFRVPTMPTTVLRPGLGFERDGVRWEILEPYLTYRDGCLAEHYKAKRTDGESGHALFAAESICIREDDREYVSWDFHANAALMGDDLVHEMQASHGL